VLLCLGDNRALFESFMEKNLHKALKDVKTRRTALECLHLLLQFYLRSKGRGWHFDTMWGRIQVCSREIYPPVCPGGCVWTRCDLRVAHVQSRGCVHTHATGRSHSVGLQSG